MVHFWVLIKHALAWCILIGGYSLYRVHIAGAEFGTEWDFILFIGYHILLFYANVLWILPKAFAGKNKKNILYRLVGYLAIEWIVLLIAMIALSIGMGALEIGFDDGVPWQIHITNFFRITLPLFYGVILSVAYYALQWGLGQYRELRTLMDQTMELKSQVEEYKQDWIKAQLNPHLLANLLTTLRGITRESPRLALDTMGLLTKMMRYYIVHSPKGLILLSDEVEQVYRLIELYKIRWNDKPRLNIQITGDMTGVEVIPMLVFLLVENMFNHGDLQNRDKPASLLVQIKGNDLHIETNNWIKEGPTDISGTRQGLQNLQSRLAHFYPNRHQFHSHTKHGFFHVEVKILDIKAGYPQK